MAQHCKHALCFFISRIGSMNKSRYLAALALASLIVVGLASVHAQEIAINTGTSAVLTVSAYAIDSPTYSPRTPPQNISPLEGPQKLAQCAARCTSAAHPHYCPGTTWCCGAGQFYCPGNPAGKECVSAGNPQGCQGRKITCCPGPGNTCTNGC